MARIFIIEIYRDGQWVTVGETLESTPTKAVKVFARQYPNTPIRARSR